MENKLNKEYDVHLEKAEKDLQLLHIEVNALQSEIDNATGIEEELKKLKQQWFVKEQMLRALATRNAVQYRNKIKRLRVNLRSYIAQNVKTANKQTHATSYTTSGRLLHDVLSEVKRRRRTFNRWLNKNKPVQPEETLQIHKQTFQILAEIEVLVKKLYKIAKINNEMNGYKKAIKDVKSFLESHQDLVKNWCSKVFPSWDGMTLQLTQEGSTMDMQNVLNTVNMTNGALQPHEASPPNDENQGSNVKPCQTIQNTCTYKDLNTPICHICKQNRDHNIPLPGVNPIKRRPTGRKGIKHSSTLDPNDNVFQYTIKYVIRKTSKKCLDFVDSIKGRESNHFTGSKRAETNHRSTEADIETDAEIDTISKEYHVWSPISNFGESIAHFEIPRSSENEANHVTGTSTPFLNGEAEGQTFIPDSEKEFIHGFVNNEPTETANTSEITNSETCARGNSSNAMFLKEIVDEACSDSQVSTWPWENQFSQAANTDAHDLNWKQCVSMCKVPANNAVSESSSWIYKGDGGARKLESITADIYIEKSHGREFNGYSNMSTCERNIHQDLPK